MQNNTGTHGGQMTGTVRDLMKKLTDLGGSDNTAEQWVEITVKKMVGLGGPDMTYTGCAKQVYGPPGCLPWQCRKRVAVGDRLDDEINNHNYRHAGNCSLERNGMRCYAMMLTIEDETSFTTAQIWAPAIHMLGMFPSHFQRLSERGMAEVISSVLTKPFRLRVMIIGRRRHGHIFKVLWVEPVPSIHRQPCRPENNEEVPDVYDLVSSMGSLLVSDISEVDGTEQERAEVHTEGVVTVTQAEAADVLNSLSCSLHSLFDTQERLRMEISSIISDLQLVKARLGLGL